MKPEQIRDLRIRLGLSTMALAILLGVSVDTVRSWEQGRRTPNAAVASLLDDLSASQGGIYRDPESAPETSYGSRSTEQPTPDELDTDEVEDAA